MANRDSSKTIISKFDKILSKSQAKDNENSQQMEERTIAMSPSNELKAESSNDEKSAFFEQWKAKHAAYLAKLDEQLETVEEVTQIKKSRLFQGINKSKEKEATKKKAENKVRDRTPLPPSVFLKATPVIGMSILLAALSLYFISPTSKAKHIVVTGNQRLSVKQIETYSHISPKDYILTTALNASDYAENIKKSSLSIEFANISYQFPNKFTINIKEYAIIGYILNQSHYLPVLASGEVATEETTSDALPETYTTIHLSDREMIKNLAIELGKLDQETRSKIQTVNLTPSAVTKDLLTLNMTDGNTVLVPLSEVSQKMKYYAKIAAEVTTATTIDMEVGIYRYAS